MRRLLAAAAVAVAAVTGVALPAAAESSCTEVDTGFSSAGYCYVDPCHVVWVDPSAQLQDETVVVSACGERAPTEICVGYARQYRCLT